MSWIKEIGNHHRPPKYSQYGEEWYLNFIFRKIGVTNKFFVDIGAWDGFHLSNTRLFKDIGWIGVLIDGKDYPGVHRSFVTKENILETLDKLNVPEEFDLLSIDIDGNDYWVLKEVLTKYKPRVIISEYNAEHEGSKAIEYDPKFVFKADEYYGYTFEAGEKLAEANGYKIIFQNSNLNLYMVKKELLPEENVNVPHPIHRWWKIKSDKTWVQV